MMRKVLLMLCTSTLVSAGVTGTDYSSPTSVSYSSSIGSPIVKTVSTPVQKTITFPTGYTKITQSPPEYHSVLTTKESNFESPDGTQHATYTKSLDTAYSSLNKFESKHTNGGDINANIIPGIYSHAVHSPVIYHHPGAAYTVSSPLVHTVHSPLTKSVAGSVSYTHEVPLTKTIVAPSLASYSTPFDDKARFLTSGVSSYSSNSPVYESHPIKTSLLYSEAPAVSHMSFTGLGTSYAW